MHVMYFNNIIIFCTIEIAYDNDHRFKAFHLVQHIEFNMRSGSKLCKQINYCRAENKRNQAKHLNIK